MGADGNLYCGVEGGAIVRVDPAARRRRSSRTPAGVPSASRPCPTAGSWSAMPTAGCSASIRPPATWRHSRATSTTYRFAFARTPPRHPMGPSGSPSRPPGSTSSTSWVPSSSTGLWSTPATSRHRRRGRRRPGRPVLRQRHQSDSGQVGPHPRRDQRIPVEPYRPRRPGSRRAPGPGRQPARLPGQHLDVHCGARLGRHDRASKRGARQAGHGRPPSSARSSGACRPSPSPDPCGCAPSPLTGAPSKTSTRRGPTSGL